MEDKQLLSLWRMQNEKIEQSLNINRTLLLDTIQQKAKHSMGSLVRLKTLGIIAFVFYLYFLGYILYSCFQNYTEVSIYFMVSLSAIFLINLRGLVDYVKHLIWTNNINYEGNILEIQQELSRLQISIVEHTKIMILQLPFWTTLYLSEEWFPSMVSWKYMIFQGLLTGTMTFCAYWLYKNQNVENLDKKWYRSLIAGSGGKSVRKALEFYKEIEIFKKEAKD